MLTIHSLRGAADALTVSSKKILPRFALTAIAVATLAIWASAAAFGQEVPSLGEVTGTGELDTVSLPSVDPTPVQELVDDLVVPSPNPIDPDALPPEADPLDEVIKKLLPPNVITDPGTDGGGGGGGTDGGGGGGGGGGGRTGDITTGTTIGGGAAATGSLGTRPGGDPRGPATDAASRAAGRRPYSIDEIGGRAVRLAVPLAAPIGLAIAGVLGLVMLAKSNGRLDGLDNERKAIGGWTVISL